MSVYGTCPDCGGKTIDYECASCLRLDLDYEKRQRAENVRAANELLDYGVRMDGIIADLRQQLAKAKAVIDRLEKTSDGVPIVPCENKTFWAVYREDQDVPWKVGPCHLPSCPEEHDTGFEWIIDDAEDESLVDGIYSTREAAQAAKEERR